MHHQGDTGRLAKAADLIKLERHEIVGGELVEKAAPSFEHGGAQIAIGGLLYGFQGQGGGRGPGGWWLGTEVEIELEQHEVYLPDVAGWRIKRVPERPRGRPILIAPDWICEILSPSTASRDLGPKQRGYHRAGVEYFWVLDPQNLLLSVLRRYETGYQIILTAGPGETVRAEPFDDVAISMSEILGVNG